jgi:hypothetical protein
MSNSLKKSKQKPAALQQQTQKNEQTTQPPLSKKQLKKRKFEAAKLPVAKPLQLDSSMMKPTAPKIRKLTVVDASTAEMGLGSEAHFNGVEEEVDAGAEADDEYRRGRGPPGGFKTSAADVEELGMSAFEGRDKRAAEKKRLERIGARYWHIQHA